MNHESFRSRLARALVAGSVAITLNTLALKAADLIQLPTARGGLLRLLCAGFSRPFEQLGITSIWEAIGAPAPNSPPFQIGFHILVGLMMALFYALWLEPAIPWGTTIKGLVYLVVVWLINAFIVLPATGEGFAGSANLTFAGMAWYATSHSIFFMILAYSYAFLSKAKAPDRGSHLASSNG